MLPLSPIPPRSLSRVSLLTHTHTQGDGTRIFYESLLQENPQSDIAFKWCVEHGIYLDLDPEKAARRLDKKNTQRKQRQNGGVVVKKKKKKRRVSSSAAGGVTAAEVGMSLGTGWEGQGSMGL